MHTKEPWTCCLMGGVAFLLDQDGATIALLEKPNPEIAYADTRRICACVNACAGIPTEQLERGDLGGKDTIMNPRALWGREMSAEEMHRLIAAAPDLLTALQKLAHEAEPANATMVREAGIGVIDVIAIHEARAAIAKAGGKQE